MSKRRFVPSMRNETLLEIYDGYRAEMRRTLRLEDSAPHKFANVEFVEYFERRVDRLSVLISLYADLMLAMRNRA